MIPPEALRAKINNIRREIAQTEQKHRGTAEALALRRKTLARLEAELAMASPRSAPMLVAG